MDSNPFKEQGRNRFLPKDGIFQFVLTQATHLLQAQIFLLLQSYTGCMLGEICKPLVNGVKLQIDNPLPKK